ncbi:antirestriction protein [Methylomonas methanica]|uniref:Antirestriction protein n=1 Tax=Methylomonas methanica TaxID=421 RepID=A0A177MJ06_METMH|nr:antirestriction protein [Methylomonas methanica]OAI04890.1 hypothetical protein A1332_13775 [Methylomonas methanica]
MLENVDVPAVSSSLVADGNRLDFLPKYFGGIELMVTGEMLVYQTAETLCPDYKGGYWLFHELSNGGFYMAPDSDEPMRISVDGNWFDGVMSSDAAGIVITLFAVNRLIHTMHGRRNVDALIDRYHWLRAFAAEHADARLILAAID